MTTGNDILALHLRYDKDTGEIFAPATGRDRVREVAFLTGDINEGDKLGPLFAAAPDMARALLRWLPYSGHTMECGNLSGDDAKCSDECRESRAALKKAGIL